MSEELLDFVDTHTALDEPGGECVSQTVKMKGPWQSRLPNAESEFSGKEIRSDWLSLECEHMFFMHVRIAIFQENIDPFVHWNRSRLAGFGCKRFAV